MNINVICNIIQKGYDTIVTPNLGQLNIESKSDGSVVTQVDRNLETFLQTELLALIPNSVWIGEETYRADIRIPTDKFVWLVDPIDGTASFAIGGNHWGTMVALYYGHAPILAVIYRPNPSTWLTWDGTTVTLNGVPILPYAACALSGNGTIHNHATPEVRKTPGFKQVGLSGMACIESLRLTTSLSEFFVTDYVTPWDFAAPLAIHRALGGVDGFSDNTRFDLTLQRRPFILARNQTDWNTLQSRLIPLYWK